MRGIRRGETGGFVLSARGMTTEQHTVCFTKTVRVRHIDLCGLFCKDVMVLN